MKKRTLGRSTVLVLALAGGASAAAAQAPAPVARALYDSAYFAWDRGDYPAALDHAERLLEHPEGAQFTERVALLTGEAWTVTEVTPNGQYPRWSPDGAHLSYEVGTGAAARVQVVRVADATEVASFPGWEARFSPDGASVAYFRVPPSARLDEARAREQAALAAGDVQAVRQARQQLSELEAADAEIVVRALATGEERILAAPELQRFGLDFGSEGEVILIGRRDGEGDRLDLYRIGNDGTAEPLTSGPGNKGSRVLRGAGGRLVYPIGSDRIGILGPTGETRVLEGRSPALSRDGSTLAYIATVRSRDPELRSGAAVGAEVRANGDLQAVMVLDLTGAAEPREVKRTTLPLADPVLSPSGRRVAYNTILRDDWEVFIVNADGTGEERVTRDIQHDLFPEFLSESRLLVKMGEARHRRAYIHELDDGRAATIAGLALPGDDQRGRKQLFHNNTIRTVAPQYDWAPSPDGSRIAVVADRDGDTLSPERGIYIVDTNAPVTREAVLARVREQRAIERALRDWGREMFAPIEGAVRAATEEVDAGRVYDHAHALYQFDSKFITQPGNALAVEYLTNALRAMGYEPELQWFEPRPGIRSANVVVTIPGTVRPERINVVSSHFDSVERGPGADDNSSGTTALLEVARVLVDRPQPETIRLAFLTAEEAGLIGAREFVRRAVENGELIVGVLNNDMIGWTRSHRLDNTIRYSNDTIRDIQHNAAILFSDLITYDARYVRSTDAQAFWDNYGDIVGGIGSYPILSNPHYHQPHDALEVIDHRLVAEVARTTVATIMRLANGWERE